MNMWFRGGRAPLNRSVHEGLGPPHPHWGFHHQTPDVSGLNHPSETVIGYYWLAFLYKSSKLKMKILIIEEIKKNWKHFFAYVSEITHILKEKKIGQFWRGRGLHGRF